MHFFLTAHANYTSDEQANKWTGVQRAGGDGQRGGRDEWTDESDELKPLMLRLKLKAHLRQHQQKWTTANAVPRPRSRPRPCLQPRSPSSDKAVK